MAAKLSDEIDSLLEQYLRLLDQYTTLRSQLSTAQSSVPQFPIPHPPQKLTAISRFISTLQGPTSLPIEASDMARSSTMHECERHGYAVSPSQPSPKVLPTMPQRLPQHASRCQRLPRMRRHALQTEHNRRSLRARNQQDLMVSRPWIWEERPPLTRTLLRI